MKLTIHNKLVILKKKLYHYLLLNLYGLLLCIFFLIYYALATFIIYYILFIYTIKIGNWQGALTCHLALFLYTKVHEIG